MEEPFFNFELFAPIVTFESQDLSDVLASLFDYEILPMSIITNKDNPVFDAIVDKRALRSTPIASVIIPIRYLKTFLA